MSIGIKMGEDIFPSPLRTYDLKVTIETMATIEDFHFPKYFFLFT